MLPQETPAPPRLPALLRCHLLPATVIGKHPFALLRRKLLELLGAQIHPLALNLKLAPLVECLDDAFTFLRRQIAERLKVLPCLLAPLGSHLLLGAIRSMQKPSAGRRPRVRKMRNPQWLAVR